MAEYRVCAAIFLFAPRLRKRFGQAHHIPQTQIKTLTRDGVKRLRGVADQRHAVRNRL